MKLSTALLTIVTFQLPLPSVCKKPYKIEILEQIVGDYEIIALASTFATEWVNNQTNILPDYELSLKIVDEGYLGSNVPRNIIKFIRSHENETINSASPISIGPLYTPGCKAGGKFAHHVDHIMLSPSCTGSMLNNRNDYPNLFLALSTLNPQSYGILKFMREIGGWNKFALYTNPYNANDFGFAKMFYQVANEIGMEVLILDSVIDFDHESALALGKSHARIIVIWSSSNFFDFFCKIWNVGIKGERYIFFTFNMDLDFNDYDCPEALKDQHKRVLVLNTAALSGDPNGISSFGYTRNQFEKLFENYLKFEKNLTNVRDMEYQFVSNDLIMQVAVILDASEKRLKADQNLTIRDFNTERQKVMEVIYDEALHVDFPALRADRITYTDLQEPANLTKFISGRREDERQIFILFWISNFSQTKCSNICL